MVGPRDSHRAGLSVHARRERLAQGQDASAHALLSLQNERLVAGREQLMGGHETGDSGAYDHHPLGLSRP